MGTDTKIQWCQHSWSPWRGCSKVSPGCELCYAEAQSRRNPRVLGVWGEDGTRPSAAADYWRLPLRWNETALSSGHRDRVFCGSLMDFFEDREELLPHRERALNTAWVCDALDWMFLSKRPENAARLLERAVCSGAAGGHSNYLEAIRAEMPSHLWFGVTVENQEYAQRRIPLLCGLPAALRFLSCEPLLGPVDLEPYLAAGGIGWVIVGGESNQGGRRARAVELSWIESVVGACALHKVPVFVKQLGDNAVEDVRDARTSLRLLAHHGGDPTEWPDWLRVRQIPTLSRSVPVA